METRVRIKFRHTCGKKISCPERLAGKAVKCPRCGQAAPVPDKVGDHTLSHEPPRLADDRACHLRRAGQGVVVSTTVGQIKADAGAGVLTSDDMVRLSDTEEWMPLRRHPQLAAHLNDAPSRVGGIRFDSEEPETEEDTATDRPTPKGPCHFHPDRPAERVCCHCGKALCPECRNRLQQEIFCEDCSNELIATLEADADAAQRVSNTDLLDETPAEAMTSVPVTTLPGRPRPQESPSGTGLGIEQIAADNRAVYIELGFAYALSWLGIGWLCAGRATTGLLLLAGNFCAVIVELLVLHASQAKLPTFAEGLWWIVPAILLQNILLGTASAYALRRASVREQT